VWETPLSSLKLFWGLYENTNTNPNNNLISNFNNTILKILILANNCKWKTWDKKIQELKDWWMPEIDLDVTLEHTDFKNIPWVEYTNLDGKIYKGIEQGWYDKNISIPAVNRGFDCVMFTVGTDEWTFKDIDGWNTHNNLGIHEIQIKGQENAKYSFNGKKYEGDQWFNIARHELSHAIYRSRGIVDNTHKYWELGNLEAIKRELQGGFMGHSWVTYFRNLLTPVQGYKYFNQNEIEGLKPELCEMLDRARGLANTPFFLNSTVRTKEKNEAVGGVENSEHLTGESVDIRCRNSAERFAIIKALLDVGFTRIGYGKTFVHAGISKTKPNKVMWDY